MVRCASGTSADLVFSILAAFVRVPGVTPMRIFEVLAASPAASALWVVVLAIPGIVCLVFARVRDFQRHFMTRMIVRDAKPGTVIRITDRGRWGVESTYVLEVGPEWSGRGVPPASGRSLRRGRPR